MASLPVFLKQRWVLIVVVTAFILLKIPHLFYPYYWDESWPYAVAIRDMYLHGISLMPTAVDPELSRGHPLFFHAIAAAWMHVFGPSHVSMHSFALFISVLFLVSVYEAGLRFFKQRVAVMSLLLVATQVVFFVQSSFVLFEVLVAFLAFLSLCFYVSDKYLLTALCLTALFYTKESGLIMGFVLGADAFIGFFNKGKDWRMRLSRLASVAVPVLLIAVFFVIQKHIRGWYIFPLYNDLIQHKWNMFWFNFRMQAVRDAFYVDLKFWYFILLLLLSIVAAIKNKSFKYLAILLPATCIYYFVDDMRAGRLLPGVPFFIVFISSIIFLLYMLRRLGIYKDARQERFTVLSCAFIFCFFCFSAMNFFTYRYLLAAIIPLLFFTAVIYDVLIDRTYPVLYYPALGVMLIISYFSFSTSNGYGDADLKAFSGMDIQQKVVDYMERMNYYDKIIGCGSFLESQHLQNPATGFLHSRRAFKNVSWYIDNKTDCAIFDNLEPDYRYKTEFNRDSSFMLVYRYQEGEKWAEVYCRKR